MVMSVCVMAVSAIPARRGIWRTVTLGDGTQLQVELRGNEYMHFWQASDGRCFIKNESGEYVLTQRESLLSRAETNKARVRGNTGQQRSHYSSKAFTEKDNQIFNYLYNKETYFEAVLQTESEIVVPIKDENTVYGVLNSESERNNHYHKNMIDGISELATELAKNLKRLGFSSTLSPQDLPHLHYENGIFQKLKFTNRT